MYCLWCKKCLYHEKVHLIKCFRGWQQVENCPPLPIWGLCNAPLAPSLQWQTQPSQGWLQQSHWGLEWEGPGFDAASDFLPLFSLFITLYQWIKWQQRHLYSRAVVGAHIWAGHSLELLCVPGRAGHGLRGSSPEKVWDWAAIDPEGDGNGHPTSTRKGHLCTGHDRSAGLHNACDIFQAPPSFLCASPYRSTCETSAGKQVQPFWILLSPFPGVCCKAEMWKALLDCYCFNFRRKRIF